MSIQTIPPEEFSRVFLYTRKSTDEYSGRQVHSIDQQRRECEDLADELGLEIVDEFTDEASAKSPYNRKQFDLMIEELEESNPEKRRADAILAWHPDRLSRNAMEAGIIIQMVDDGLIKDLFFKSYRFHNDSSGKEHIAMEFARAKGYSDHLSDTVLRGMTSREQAGALLYGDKFGYQKIREDRDSSRCSLYPIPEPTDFPIIKKMFELRAEGKSYEAIREYLIENDMIPRSGKVPYKSCISRYINNPFYFGVEVINKGEPEERQIDRRTISAPNGDEFEPAVTEEIFWRCKQYSNEGDQIIVPRQEEKIPLRGMIKCASCERVLQKETKKIKKTGGGTEPQLGFRCPTKGCIGRIKAEDVFKIIESKLRDGLGITPKEVKQFLIYQNQFIEEQKIQINKQNRDLGRKKTNAQKQVMELTRKLASLRIIESTTEEELNLTQSDLDEAKIRLTAIRKKQTAIDNNFDNTIQTFEEILELNFNAHKYWDKADLEKKFQLSELLLSNLVAHDKENLSITFKEPFSKWLSNPDCSEWSG